MALVDLVAPDGSTSAVDEADVQAAMAAGFRTPLPTEMVAPDGAVSDVGEHVAEAEQAGFRRPYAPAPAEPVAGPNEGGLSQLVAAAEGLGAGTFFGGMSQPLAALEGVGKYLGSQAAGANIQAGLDSTGGGMQVGQGPDLMSSLESARNEMAARQDANPWTHGLANAGGAVAATIATGGAAAIPAVEALTARTTAAVAAKIGADAARIATGTLGQRIILQTVKAGIPNVIEGAAFGAAQGIDAGLQAAYAVDGELNAGDYLSVAESGLQGLAVGTALAVVATGVTTGVAELATGAGRAIGGMFGRGAAAADEAVPLPTGETKLLGDPEAEIEAIGMKRMSAGLPDADVQPPPLVPGQSLALAQLDEAALGRPVSPFAKGYTPGKAVPDAEKAIDDQGHLFFEDAAPDARRRAERLNEAVNAKRAPGDTVRAFADPKAVQDDAVRSIIDDHDELLKIQDRARVLNGIGAKRAKIASMFDAPSAPASDGVGIVLADGTQGVPSASYRPDPRTVATIQNIVTRVKDALVDGTTYELQELGGKGRGIVMAKAIQQKATEYEQALAQGKAGTGYMILDDLKRIFGDFSQAKNQKIRMLVTGVDGNGGIYGDLQRHLMDEDVFMGLAQMQRPANEAWSAMITASKDDYLRPFSMQAGERGTNAFEQARRTNGPQIRTMLNTLLDEEQKNSQKAFVRHGRAVANDLKVRAETWGDEAAKADALRAQVLVARIEAKRDAAAHALRVQKSVEAAKEVLGNTPVVGGIGANALKIAQTVAKAVGRAPSPAENVAHAAVQANASIARHAETAAHAATGAAQAATGAAERTTAAAKVARASTSAALIASRAASQATIQAYARDTQPGSDQQRMKLNDAAMLADEAPELVKPLQDLQKAKDAFLAEKLAPVVASGKVDPVSQVKIVRYINAAERPDQAMERIANRGATAEDIETMWALNPSQMGKLRDATMAAIAKQKKPPTRDAQAYFTRVFRLHDSEYLQWLKAAAPPPEPPAQPSSATIKFAMPDPSLRSDELLK